ncbi:hypothetical protein HDU97_009493 [Phlyctochytrium planicorne]|nr:hypothetical protein HDU97_009493 [Phlyctochytrium planicorne]
MASKYGWARGITHILILSRFLALAITKNYTSSINILLVNPGFLDVDNVFTESTIYRATVEAAIEDVATSPHILPDTEVKVIEVDNWNPLFRDAIATITSGGYSSAAVYDAVTSNNVVSIIGDSYSKTTMFSAGVASQLQIPFCGNFQGSPKLSDKKAYPYFFRTISGRGMATHVVRLLEYYGVKRVLLLHGPDLYSVSQSIELKESFASSQVSVTTNILVDLNQNLNGTYDAMRRSKTKFIIAALLPTDTSDFYYKAAKAGFVGKDFVWLCYNAPSVPPNDEDRVDIIGEEPINNAAQLWDCVKVVLMGISQYLSDHPEISAEDLSKQEYRKALDISKFQNTGYSGASYISIDFFDDGGLKR